jgi:hypothetical protein
MHEPELALACSVFGEVDTQLVQMKNLTNNIGSISMDSVAIEVNRSSPDSKDVTLM